MSGMKFPCETFLRQLMKIDNPHTRERENEIEYQSRLTSVKLKINKFNHVESLEIVHLWCCIMALTHSSKVGHIWMAFKQISNDLFPH